MITRYKIILSNTKEEITIREDELPKVLRGIQAGGSVVVMEGIFNPSYYVCIVPDHQRMRQLLESQNENYKSKFQEPSPFARLISGKMTMLSDGERTKMQEKSGAGIRPSGKI